MGHGGSFHDLALRGRALDPDVRTAQKPDATKPPTEGPSFWDFLDVINPLQHIPLVNSLYRNLTGDQITPMARTIGGAVFGGPLGLVASVYENMVTQTSGKDFGEQIANLIGGNGDATIDQLPERTAMALETPATPPPASETTASAPPLDITIHPSPQHAHSADTPAPQPTQMVLAQSTEPSAPPPPPTESPHANTFMPLNDKVRRVPNNVKFRTVPGLSSARVFNPKNAPKAEGNIAPPDPNANAVAPADIDRALNKAAASAQITTPPPASPIDINDRMARALEKYQAMQRMGQPAPAPTITP